MPAARSKGATTQLVAPVIGSLLRLTSQITSGFFFACAAVGGVIIATAIMRALRIGGLELDERLAQLLCQRIEPFVRCRNVASAEAVRAQLEEERGP